MANNTIYQLHQFDTELVLNFQSQLIWASKTQTLFIAESCLEMSRVITIYQLHRFGRAGLLPPASAITDPLSLIPTINHQTSSHIILRGIIRKPESKEKRI